MGERNGRKNYIEQGGIRGVTMWIVFLLFLIKVVYMSYKNGMQGMTYYALADAVYILGYILLGLAVVPIMKKMICFQMNKGSYRNGYKVYRTISGFVHVLTVILCAFLFVFSDALSKAIFGTVLCSLMLRLVSVALLFLVFGFSIKGYLEGIGNPVPGMYADVLANLFGLIVTVIFQPAFADYGRKVAAVMGSDSYAYAYAACSGILGLLIGSVLSLLFLSFVRSVFGKEIRNRIRQDDMRKTDTVQDILWNFFVGYFKTAFIDHVGVLLVIVLVIIYCHTQGRAETGAGMLFVCGVVALPAGILVSQLTAHFTRQLVSIMRQSDFHHAKEKTSFALKMLSYAVLPYVTIGIALAPLAGKVFFDTELTGFSGFICMGMGIAAVLAYSFFVRQTYAVFAKPYMRNLYAGILGVSGILFFLLLHKCKLSGEESAAYAYLLACLVHLLVTGAAVMKKIRIFNRLITAVFMPFLASLVAAGVSYGLYRITASFMPDVVTLLLCAVVGYLIHNIIIVILHVFEAHEWSEVPFAKIPVAMAKMFGGMK
ncbi:MAG: hypothetical protein IJZ76_09990 [Lachnospiraceae bacterium]|nr:hypothetical protein [Lachnospiraceae bacterium]